MTAPTVVDSADSVGAGYTGLIFGEGGSENPDGLKGGVCAAAVEVGSSGEVAAGCVEVEFGEPG